jgi:hypothetical protein
VCVGNYLFMGYDLPSVRSMTALVGLMVGAAFYFRIEDPISSSAAFWGCVYLVSISVEMVCVKSVLNHVRMCTWTRVLLNNLITALIMAPICFFIDECARAAAAAAPRARANARAIRRARLTLAPDPPAAYGAPGIRMCPLPRVRLPPIRSNGTDGKSSRGSWRATRSSRRSASQQSRFRVRRACGCPSWASRYASR